MHDRLFFLITLYKLDTHKARTFIHMNMRTQNLPYEYLQRLSWRILEIDEVTADASLSTRTSPTIKSTTPLNLKNSLPQEVKSRI
jgi:hypothetical protein